ncbi:MAG: NapC/NirT family cytochrome c [Bryobacteraceae bacterium]
MEQKNPSARFRDWLSPLVYLSNNVISLIGVVIVTSSAILWILMLPTMVSGEVDNPYIGILGFFALPAVFIAGLLLIPLGIWVSTRRGRPVSFPPLDWTNVKLRRLVTFIALTTFVNVLIGAHLSYSAVGYMESTAFCGQTCHTVMQPEYTAYQNSPHSRVECVKCHIGPGASWFVKSKLSGAWQVIAVTLDLYPKPIPTPVKNLRPARETCEVCHWPQKFGADRVRVVPKYADDETNTLTKSVLLVRIGGAGSHRGIHSAHLGVGVNIRYAASDPQRQTIPWVEYNGADGKQLVFQAADAKGDLPGNNEIRTMDCMDCHNRPSHAYELPDRGLDKIMATGEVSPTLPFVKKTALALLKKDYPSQEQAAIDIVAGMETYYKTSQPAIWQTRQADVARASRAVGALYQRNVFPAMKVNWGIYPNNLGHNDFPGCFRCHDERTAKAGGKTLTQDCNTCHQLLAMDEADPKILADLGYN